MKGQITVTFSAKEAIAVISADLPKSVMTKVVKAFRAENSVKPQGAKASTLSRAVPKTAVKNGSAVKKTDTQPAITQ